MYCNCRQAILLDIRLEGIEEQVAKLRKAIEEGKYSTREIVGDAVLVIEAQLEQIRGDFPKNQTQPA